MKLVLLLIIFLGVISLLTTSYDQNQTQYDTEYIDMLYNQGANSFNNGNYEEAISYFDKILKIDPKDVVDMGNKGAALVAMERFDEAIEVFDAALLIEPENIGILHNKASTLSKFDKDSAVIVLDQILEIDPKNVKALNRKGIIFSGAENYDSAILIFEKVLEIDPGYEPAAAQLHNVLTMVNLSPIEGSKYKAYVQIEIRSADGHLESIVESDLIFYLPFQMADSLLNEYPVFEIVEIDGKKYEVRKIRIDFSSDVHIFIGTTALSYTDYGFDALVFASLTDGVVLSKDDTAIARWTILREIS